MSATNGATVSIWRCRAQADLRSFQLADILSLSKARKAKARTAKEQTATENRAKFGRTKAERQHEEAVRKLAEKRLDATKRED